MVDQKFPNRLRQVIKRSGLTVEQTAEETNIPLRTLFDYCAGRVPVPKDRLEALANVLGYPTEYLVPPYSDINDAYLLQYENEHNDVWTLPGVTNRLDQLRRKLFQQLFSAAGSLLFLPYKDLIQTDAWERLSLALKGSYHTDQATVAHLEAVTNMYWELYRSALAKVDLLSSVSGYLFTVTQLLHVTQPFALQTRLCCIISNTAQMLGEIYYDMNNIETAEAYYTLAIEAAHEVDNHVLKATALGRKAFLLVYSGKYEDALPILQEASSLAEKTATGKTRAWITMMEAEALSHLKKESACFSALEKTEQEFGRGQSSTGEEIGWTGFTQSRLIGYKGSCYVRLELPEEARAMINASLAAFSSAPTHRKSLLLSDLATTYIQQGEVEETCKIATEALLCAAQTKSSRALVRLREFQQTLKEWKDVASVKRFNAYLKTVRSV